MLIGLSGGEYLQALSTRFSSTWAIKTASTVTRGRSGGISTFKGCLQNSEAICLVTAPIRSWISVGSRLRRSAPDSRRVISNRFSTRWLSRPAWRVAERINSNRVAGSNWLAGKTLSDSSKLDNTPVTVARGVRNSCEMGIQQCGLQLFGVAQHFRLGCFFRKRSSPDGNCSQVYYALHQHALIVGQKVLGILRFVPENPDRLTGCY